MFLNHCTMNGDSVCFLKYIYWKRTQCVLCTTVIPQPADSIQLPAQRRLNRGFVPLSPSTPRRTHSVKTGFIRHKSDCTHCLHNERCHVNSCRTRMELFHSPLDNIWIPRKIDYNKIRPPGRSPSKKHPNYFFPFATPGVLNGRNAG